MHTVTSVGSTLASLHEILSDLNKRGITNSIIASQAGIDPHTLRDIRFGRCLSTHFETASRIAQALGRSLTSIDWGSVSLTAISGPPPGQSHDSPRRNGRYSNRICEGCNVELPASNVCSYC